MMDEDAKALSKQVAEKVRPFYQRWLRRGKEPAEAFSLTYDEAVRLVAKARGMSVDKTRFYSADVLQEAMNLATQ